MKEIKVKIDLPDWLSSFFHVHSWGKWSDLYNLEYYRKIVGTLRVRECQTCGEKQFKKEYKEKKC